MYNMPTFRNHVSVPSSKAGSRLSTSSLWRWNWHMVPKRRHIIHWHRGNTQKNIYNIQSTLRTAPGLCKNVSLQCCLVATVQLTQCLYSQICVCIHIIFTIYRRWSGKRNTNLRYQWKPRAIRGTGAIVSSALFCRFVTRIVYRVHNIRCLCSYVNVLVKL